MTDTAKHWAGLLGRVLNRLWRISSVRPVCAGVGCAVRGGTTVVGTPGVPSRFLLLTFSDNTLQSALSKSISCNGRALALRELSPRVLLKTSTCNS